MRRLLLIAYCLFPLFIILNLGKPIMGFASEARVLKLNDKKVGKIYVSFGKSTVLSFPGKPSKVVLGNKGAFTLEYIENDLAIASLNPSAQSNLFVYVQGRRFAFDLVSQGKSADEIVIVRDLDAMPVRVLK